MPSALPNLNNLDVEFLLDRSGSMITADCPGGKTRWEYGRETMQALAAQVQKYDADGITVVPFARLFRVYDNVTTGSDKIATIYKEVQPMGGTDTAKVIEARLDAYFARKTAGKAKSLVLFVLTDGEPDDKDALKRVIIQATRKLDRDEEVAICFVQVGRDVEATKFLKELDDDLVSKGAKFDIVDTLPIDEVENLSVEELIIKAFTD